MSERTSKPRTYFPVALALLAGAAIGYCLSPSPAEPRAEKTQAAEPPRKEAQKSAPDPAAERILRARVAELESQLATLRRENEAREQEKSEEREIPPPPGNRENRRFDPFGLERIKNEDPARYAQITNNMARFRSQRLVRAQAKLDFLSSVDTSKMPEAARKTHEELQDMIERREAIEEKMRDIMSMGEEDRRAVFDEMREAEMKIHELNRAERDNLLLLTADSLGFDENEAREVAETIKGIYEATSSGFGPGGGRGRGPRGPGGERGGRR